MSIKNHLTASKKLDNIKNKAFTFVSNNTGKITEYDLQQFIIKELIKENLKYHDVPIVAVNESSSEPHYFPKKESKKIKENSLVLIDLWASFNSGYYADITWIGYTGNPPEKVMDIFETVINARDLAIFFIRTNLKNKNLPYGNEIDKIVRDYLSEKNLDKYFIHSTGHSLGKDHCHGKNFNISKKESKKIEQNIPFTIEPGLYFKNKFGVRSEINCYIKDYELIITSNIQKGIIRL